MRGLQAGRPASERATVALLEVGDGALRVYKSASDRIFGVLTSMGLRHQWVRRRRTHDGYRALVDAADDLVTMWNAGATEAELRPFASFLNDLLDRLSTGRAMRALPVLDQAEQLLEAEETSLQTSRLVREAQGQPVSAMELLREADVAEAEAAVEMEKSRALRRRARQMQLSYMLMPFGALPDSTRMTAQAHGVQNFLIIFAIIVVLGAIFIPPDPVDPWADQIDELAAKRREKANAP